MTEEHTLESLVDKGTEHYFEWLRTMLNLSAASLTALVALQGQFVPQHPRWLGM